jgi:lysine-specific permease
MKVSNKTLIVPEGCPFVCYNRASFFRWIAFSYGFRNETTQAPTLRRELKARHLTMIAIGGSIGTGLFVASGATISQAGPGGALFSYILIGLMVYFLMTSLGELAAYMPVSGSFATYGQQYVEEGFGFALGWNYWYNWAVTIAVDLVASQLVMTWWFPDTPGWIWSAVFLCVIFLLNYISVKGFGEAEYWFSLIKVTTVIIFIVVGVLMIVGIFKGDQPAGWSNWQVGDAPFAGGLSAMIGVAMIVGFSFQGTELIGIAAGESEDPEKHSARGASGVLAYSAVLCVRHPGHQPDHSLYRSEPAA